MKCITFALINILHHYGKYRTKEEVQKIVNNKSRWFRFIDDRIVRKILTELNLSCNDLCADIFMPIPYLLCNGNSWVSVLPRKDSDGMIVMLIEYYGNQPGTLLDELNPPKTVNGAPNIVHGSVTLPFQAAKQRLRANGFCGGFYFLKC